jgi:hypothetical protein
MLFISRYENERVRIGVVGPLVAVLYRASPSLEDMQKLDALEGELLGKYEKISMLTLVRSTGAMHMASDVRELSVDMSHRYGARLLGSAIVVAAKGLSGVFARSLLSALLLAMRGDIPLKNFAAVGEALTWLRELPGQPPELATAVDLEQLEHYLV